MITYLYFGKTFSKVFLTYSFVIALFINTFASKTEYGKFTPVPEPPQLSGGFIQYWEDSYKTMKAAEWQNILDSMVRAGIHHTIIIQHLELKTTDGKESKYYPLNKNDFDPTKFILDYADSRTDMRVYIGLRNDTNFVQTSKWDDTDQYALQLNVKGGEADKNIALAKEAWNRYGHDKDGKLRRSFAGWYLPNEMWNQDYTKVQMTELQNFHRRISEFCKSLDKSDKPVAVSPYFNPNLSELKHLLDAEKFAQKFGEFLQPSAAGQKSAGIDILMLQDGAGERKLTADNFKEKAEPFYKSISAMAKSKNVKFWANVESWEKDVFVVDLSKTFYSFPTNINRLSKQIEITNPYVEQVVTFDFFHYMNPYGNLHDESEYKEAERNLYWCYLRKFFPKAVKDGDPQCSESEED